MTQVISIKDKDFWNFLVSLKKYITLAQEYDIPMDKERKEYEGYLSRLAS